MIRRLSIVLAVMCLAAPGWAADGNIALYFSHEGLCTMHIPFNCSGRMYVYGILQGASANGITGAEYKIAVGPNSNPDQGLLFFETFDASATVLGAALNPVDNLLRGVNVAWASCQQGEGQRVLIETVDILNLFLTFDPPQTQLQVVKHDTASNAHFQCPLFTLCDGPVYTKVCLGFVTQCQNPNPPFPNDAMCSTSGVGYINPDPQVFCCDWCTEPPTLNCSIQVEDQTWTGVKGLYR